MAKKPTPKTKPAAKKSAPTKPAAKSTTKVTTAKKTAVAKPLQNSPAKKTPAKRKSKELAVLSAKPAKPKTARPKSSQAGPTRGKSAPQASQTYLARVTHWPQEVVAGLGKMIQRAAPAKDAAKDVAAESLGWLKSRASRVKEVGQKELHELVRVASKLKELRGTPAAATGKRKSKHK